MIRARKNATKICNGGLAHYCLIDISLSKRGWKCKKSWSKQQTARKGREIIPQQIWLIIKVIAIDPERERPMTGEERRNPAS